jgi:hypothetical protein
MTSEGVTFRASMDGGSAALDPRASDLPYDLRFALTQRKVSR